MRRPLRTTALLVASCAWAGAIAFPRPAAAQAATASDPTETVLRCTDASGRVVYTDVPCGNATVVELHPGRADPAAAQRRAAAQAELDAGMSALRAREAERRASGYAAYPVYAPFAVTPVDAYVDPGFAWVGWYGPTRPGEGKRPRPPEHKPAPRPASKVPAQPRLPTAPR